MSTVLTEALSAEELMDSARAETGIDIQDTEVFEPLQVLVHSLNSESELTPSGREGMAGKIRRMLSNRLRMQRDFLAHPEIADQVVKTPVFLCGMGRTGSTKAQKLLAASGAFNWLSYWRAINPALITGDRAESPQQRVDDAEAYIQWFDAASPDLKYAHQFETHEPEEESLVLEHSLRSPTWLGWSPIGGYLEWLATQDWSRQFLFLRDTLKYLQWQGLADPEKPWVLKTPLYMGLEPALMSVFPDAKLVMTHREPSETIPSGLRLMELFHKPFTNKRTPTADYVTGQVSAIDAHMANRANLPELRFIDVHFREVTASPNHLVKRVFEAVGLPLDEAISTRVIAWDASNPPHKHGRKHIYALEDYGLSREYVDDLFREYRKLVQESL